MAVLELDGISKSYRTHLSLRKYWILRDLGFDAFAISAQVGHNTIDMAQHYSHVRPGEFERMAEAVGRATGLGTQP